MSHKEIAEQAGICTEFAALEVFLSTGFNNFDPRNCLFEASVHLAKLVTLAACNRLQCSHVALHRKDIHKYENKWHQQELHVHRRDKDDRYDHAQHGFQNNADTGVHHAVKLLNIFGCAGHHIADTLAIMESLALA